MKIAHRRIYSGMRNQVQDPVQRELVGVEKYIIGRKKLMLKLYEQDFFNYIKFYKS